MDCTKLTYYQNTGWKINYAGKELTCKKSSENLRSNLPFGELFVEQRSTANYYTPYKFSGKEKDEETSYSYFGARYYMSDVSTWLSVDEMADQAPGWTPYRYCFQNPIRIIDPNGMSEGAPSTHTDENGNVLAIYNDGDKGVYKHSGAKNASDIDAARKASGTTSGGGEKMGETENWDEFVSPETGKTMTNYGIQFGKSFDPILQKLHQKVEDDDMDLKEIASKSGGNGLFDIKKNYKNVGALLDGKYATSRSAGNYLAGFNAQRGTYFGVSISFETFQKLAGALHVMESRGLSLTTEIKINIVFFGVHFSSAPTYGEQMYQYRMSKAGWDKSKLMPH